VLHLTLRQLEYVVSVARARSLSAAAAALNVSQPSLSVALGQVEATLGEKLFIRSKGAPLRMTMFANRFVAEAEALLAMARRLEDPATIQRAVNGTVVLGCFEDLAPQYLAPMLRLLRTTLPGVEIIWKIADFETLARDMREGRISLSLTYDLGLDSGFDRIALAEVTPHAFVAADHPLANKATLTLTDLVTEPLILFEEMLSNRHTLQLFRSQGLSPGVAHRVRSLEIMRSMAAFGEGVGISYTRPPGDQSYDGARVNAVPIIDSIAREPIILAHAFDTGTSAVVMATIAAITTMFQQIAPAHAALQVSVQTGAQAPSRPMSAP